MRALFSSMVLLVFLASNAAASPLTGPPPPAIMNTAYQDSTIYIEWEPVPNADHYTIYRDGSPIAQVTDTTYTTFIEDELDVFWVTATANNEESPASEPIIAPGSSTRCEIIGFTVITNYPFFGYGIEWHCIPLLPGTLVSEPQISDFVRES